MSPYNISPSVWGKSFWNTIYYVVISYSDKPTDDDKIHVKNFLESLQFVLPCENCRYHYGENLKRSPITNEVLASRVNLLVWTVNVNNEVNKRLGKPAITVEKIIQKYTQNNDNNDINDNWKFIATIILLVFLIVLLIYYVKKY